jgi:putative nucleotidyltransferase with HDIG domain
MAGAAEVLKDILVSLVTERKRSRVEEGRDIVTSIMKGLRQEGMLIDRLIRLQGHDDYTVTHSLNVCILVVSQATHLGIPENRVREAGLAALLHDVGKEMTPAAILTKPSRLDLDEFDQVKRHPAVGAKTLRRIDCGTELPMIVAFEHHIKYDRSGYPKVRTQESLHIASYMTQIADVYDALRSYRPYQPSIELERTLSIMKEGRGTEFEPRLFDNFVEILS